MSIFPNKAFAFSLKRLNANDIAAKLTHTTLLKFTSCFPPSINYSNLTWHQMQTNNVPTSIQRWARKFYVELEPV